jgi:protein-S-isoprenylcysteine O-methyltransferase Ste14
MNPVLRPLLIFGGWAIWLAPFFLFRPRDRPKAVQIKPAARVGIILQSVAFFLVFMHRPAGWDEPLAAWRAAVGLVFAGTALVLSWQSVRTLGRQWRVDAGLNADHELVRAGPYRVVRHPIYASMLCMLLAGIAWCGTLPGWPVALVFFFAGIEIRVRVEDSLLSERFGSEFASWTQSTPAYIPFVR